jgi:hypothetical protein
MEKQFIYKGVKLELVHTNDNNPCKSCFFINIKDFICRDNCQIGSEFDCQDKYFFKKVSEIKKKLKNIWNMKKVFLNGTYYYVVDNPNKGICRYCAVDGLMLTNCWLYCGEGILKKVSDFREEKIKKLFNEK